MSRDFIYGDPGEFRPDYQQLFERIEKALGFKLFFWQKSYIAHGQFRRYGATTAHILKDLVDLRNGPIDRSRAFSRQDEFYTHELRKIKEQLELAGIDTNTVFFNRKEADNYYNYATRHITEDFNKPPCGVLGDKIIQSTTTPHWNIGAPLMPQATSKRRSNK